MVAGNGCYTAGTEIFASVLGTVKVSPAPEGRGSAKMVEVLRNKSEQSAAQVLPQIGSIIIAKVLTRLENSRTGACFRLLHPFFFLSILPLYEPLSCIQSLTCP